MISGRFVRLIFFSFSFLSSVFSFTGFYAYAQVTGDYRSDISVLATDWSDRNNWQIFKGSWQSPNATDGYPGQFRSPGTVTIREHIFIFFPLAVVADITPPFAINNLVVNDGGELNTTGDPSLTIAQTLTVSNGGSMSFGGGGDLSVAGATNIAGAFTDSNGVGSTSLRGPVSVTGSFTATAITTASRMVFQQGIVQNGTFNGGAATFDTNNQSISGNNAVSFSGDVNITDVTLTMSNGNTLFVGAATTLTTSGGFTRSNGNANSTFAGNVNIGPGTTFNTTSVVNNANLLTFRGGITNNGTFNGGSATFGTNNQSLTGANDITFSNSVVVTGIIVTNSNSGQVSINGVNTPVLSGTGNWAQNVNSTLNFNGQTITLASLNASATGNTVNYKRSSAQTIFTPTSSYYHLTLSGGGIKRSSNNLDINGDLLISGTASLDVATGNDDVTIAGNWTVTNSTGDPFVQGNRTVTFDGSSQQTLTTALAAGETFYRLATNNTSATIPQVTFSSVVAVTNRYDLNRGVVDLTNKTFTLGQSGAVSTLARGGATSGWMYNGTFKRFWRSGIAITNSDYGLFPLGHSDAGSYRPITIASTGGNTTATGSFSATHVHADDVTDLSPTYPDGGATITRKHEAQFLTSYSGITTAGGVRFTITATMTGLLSTGTAADIRLAISNGATTVTNAGSHVASSGSAANPTASRGGLLLSDLNNKDWRITTANIPVTPLPVELVSFAALLVNDVVNLNWRTASELNNQFFTLERASDLEHFESFFEIDGAGTTNQPRDYAHIDTTPLYGRSYYRLMQTDFDGQHTYSKVVTVDYAGPRLASLNVYPNPSDGSTINLMVNGLQGQTAIPVQVLDSRGVVVYERTFQIGSPGAFQRQIKFPASLKPGLYFFRAGQTLNLIQKLIVK